MGWLKVSRFAIPLSGGRTRRHCTYNVFIDRCCPCFSIIYLEVSEFRRRLEIGTNLDVMHQKKGPADHDFTQFQLATAQKANFKVRHTY